MTPPWVPRAIRLAGAVLALTLVSIARADDPPLTILVPGLTARALPVTLTNVNGLAFGPDGRLYALGYDGKVRRLIDADGDGLEDRAEVYWDGDTLVSPIAMLWSKDGLYVSSHQKVSLLRDTDGDGRADREEVVATGWPKIPTGSNLIDAMGIALDAQNNLYIGIGCADFTNPYLVKDGKSHYDPRAELGAILKVAPDRARREVFAAGLRFTYALKFNKAGDLFATDQEGETWLGGANPLDELNQIVAGRHYGWPPRHPQYLPDIRNEPPLVGFAPQHQSACGLVFDESGAHTKRFGPESWEGDAFVALYSRGRLARVRLVKTPNGYVAQPRAFAVGTRMPTDVTLSPDGALYVSLHSGQPDWGTGPQGEGTIVKITYEDKEVPQPVIAWPSGPLEVRVAFDRPLDPSRLDALPGVPIAFGRHVRAGDAHEVFKPPYKAVQAQLAAPRGTLHVASARLDDDGRTLVLATDPHPWEATYAFALPGLGGRDSSGQAIDLDYDLTGAEVTWEPDDAAAEATPAAFWWPHLDPDVVSRLTEGSAPHAASLANLDRPGHLTFRALVRLPEAHSTLILEAARPLAIEDATLDGDTGEPSDDGVRTAFDVKAADQPLDLFITLRTGPSNAGEHPSFRVSYRTEHDPTERPLRLEQLLVPWTPAPTPAPSESAAVPPELAGGDPARGAAIFRGEEAKCATCHAFRGEGGKVGPDLSNLHERDAASIYRDIAEPSATINPDYVPYTVVLKDGRVLAGVVRSEGADAIRVLDTDAQETRVNRADIEELRPSSTSIMPVGLSGALGEQQLKDLVAYLMAPPEAK
jgi:putative heme-binding domain-containing protein